MAQLLFFRDDLHGPSAQNKAGTHQHRVSDRPGSSHTVLNFRYGFTPGSGNMQTLQQILKSVPVLRLFNGSAVGTDALHTQICLWLGKVDGSLAAQTGNHALRLFQQNNVHHIFCC